MKLLALDTSTHLATVALSIDGMIFTDQKDSLRQHAQCLLPMIEGLLHQANISLNELDGLVFGRGPGSFTGLRISCSVAQALAYAHDLPVYPVSSLAAIADEVYHTNSHLAPESKVLAMIDARMNQLYWASFTRQGIVSPEQVTAANDILISTSTPLTMAGVGIEEYQLQIPHYQTHELIYPQALAMIRLVKQGGIAPVNAMDAMPVYVRELQLIKPNQG